MNWPTALWGIANLAIGLVVGGFLVLLMLSTIGISKLVAPDLVTAYVTGILAIIAFVQALLFFRQLRIMNDGLLATAEASKAAATSAETALEANKINREVFVKTERPWLRLNVEVGGDFYFGQDEDAEIPMKFTIENIGRSPAIRATIYIQSHYRDFAAKTAYSRVLHDFQSKAVGQFRSQELDIAGDVIFPNDKIIRRKVEFISGEDLEELTKKRPFFEVVFAVVLVYGTTHDPAAKFVTGYLVSPRARASEDRAGGPLIVRHLNPSRGTIPETSAFFEQAGYGRFIAD